MSKVGWLRLCATSRKVAGSISDGVIDITHPTLPLKNNSQGCLLWGKCGRRLGLATLPPSCADCLEILGAPTS